MTSANCIVQDRFSATFFIPLELLVMFILMVSFDF